jgi:hypothetical protein
MKRNVTAPRYLDDALLEQLEERLLDHPNSTLRERLQPGLPDERINSLTASLSFHLPEEARRWYRWHNGSSGYDITIRRAMTGLADDVKQTLEFQDEDEHWNHGWLKVMTEKPYMVFDCSGSQTEPVAVWHYDYEFPRPTRPVFASIGDMVAFWIQLIDDDLMVWDVERGWQYANRSPLTFNR